MEIKERAQNCIDELADLAMGVGKDTDFYAECANVIQELLDFYVECANVIQELLEKLDESGRR